MSLYDNSFEVDYVQALKEGEVKIAYARIMLIGPGGVGKSSLLNGLMNLPLPHEAYSTQLADTYTLKRKGRPSETFWAKQVEGGYWVKVNDKDEIDELVYLVETVKEKKQSQLCQETGATGSSGRKFAHSDVQPIINELAANLKSTSNTFVSGTEVYMRVWDCGGQPVFLDILPAFLTARTLFLLMFDARHDLRKPCRHLTHNKRKAKEEQEEITTLELLTQWMATIHATLLKRDPSDSSSNQEQRFPQILPVGTHGDHALNKDTIFEPLSSVCADKAFMHLVQDGLIVDNTTAGKGSQEDPSFKVIRDAADNFASTNVATRTPVRWVLFRKVFERYAKGKPVVPLDKVKELGRECDIPEEAMDSVLEFYHDLAVFFHYKEVPSLREVVIADPQWLVRQMAKILALEGFEIVKNMNLWKLLREDGILLQPLYEKVLGTENELSPQEIIDLLEHFLIIAEIHTTGKHTVRNAREYFTPSLLPCCPSKKSSYSATTKIQSAAPLHLIFSTKYLPPGFFTRLAAVLSKHPKCQVDFTTNCKIYRNEVKYLFGAAGQQVDKLVVTEKKFSICVQVQRVSTRSFKYPTFISVCSELFQILQDSFREVKKWLPQIDVSFALECEKCVEKDHFIPLSAPRIITSHINLLCQRNVRTILNSDQKFWLNIHQVINYCLYYISGYHVDCMVMVQDHPTDPDLSDREISVIAREVERLGKVSDLAEALEMADHTENDATILLQRWRKEMTSLKTQTRKDILFHLTNMEGLEQLVKWLVEICNGCLSTSSSHVVGCSTMKLQAKNLMRFRSLKMRMINLKVTLVRFSMKMINLRV